MTAVAPGLQATFWVPSHQSVRVPRLLQLPEPSCKPGVFRGGASHWRLIPGALTVAKTSRMRGKTSLRRLASGRLRARLIGGRMHVVMVLMGFFLGRGPILSARPDPKAGQNRSRIHYWSSPLVVLFVGLSRWFLS